MQYLYSFETGFFYEKSMHGDKVPADAVKLTLDEYEELKNGRASGRVIHNEGGRPVLRDYEMTAEQSQARVNAEARAYLASTDWYVIRQQETGQPVPSDVQALRAAARERVIA